MTGSTASVLRPPPWLAGRGGRRRRHGRRRRACSRGGRRADEDICHGGDTTVYTSSGLMERPVRRAAGDRRLRLGPGGRAGRDRERGRRGEARTRACPRRPHPGRAARRSSGVTGSCFGPPTPSVAPPTGTVFVRDRRRRTRTGAIRAGRAVARWLAARPSDGVRLFVPRLRAPARRSPAAGMATYVAMQPRRRLGAGRRVDRVVRCRAGRPT